MAPERRRTRRLIPGVAIVVTLMGGAFVTPVLAQDAAVFADVDRAMENYRLDAHIPGMVWGIVQDGRLVHVKGAGVQDIDTKRPVNADTLFRIASMTKAFTALSILKLRDDGKLALDAPVGDLRAGAARLEVPDGRLAEDSRARAADAHRGLRHRRSLGRSADAAARRATSPVCSATACRSRDRRRRRWSTRISATPCSAASSPTCRGSRTRISSSGLLFAPLGMACHRLRRGCRSSGASRARLPLGRQRLEARADDGARRVRRDGRHPDQRHRLREVGVVSPVRVAASRRRRHRTGATIERARAGAGGELSLGSAATGIERSRGVP